MAEHAYDPDAPSKPVSARAVLVLIVLVAVLIALVVAQGMFTRDRTMTELRRATQAEAIQHVRAISPRQGPPTRSLDLPGNVAAWYEAPIYGQVTGYLSHWYTDYGALVQAGQKLAVIDTPDLDEQLDAARADLAVAQARYALAVLTAKRWKGLAGTQAVSQQQVDVYQADAEAQKAQVSAQEHNVRRFEAREGFKTLRAPFAGIVTARRTDIGDYVNASGGTTRDGGSQQGRSSELFRVADVHEMRVFVSVPQDFAGYMKPGISASFTVQQNHNRVYPAKFLTTAGAVTPDTRTVVTELTVGNDDHSLSPGSYAAVHFTIPTDEGLLIVPSASVLFQAQGLVVCLIGKDDRIHLQKVTVGLDLEDAVQITGGLKKEDRLVASPSEGLLEGEKVVVEQDARPATAKQDRKG